MTIQEHVLCCNYCPPFENGSIFTRKSNEFELEIMECLVLARNSPSLDKADSSLP